MADQEFDFRRGARIPPPIHKSEGVNDSERYLAQLCSNTFLGLWSYSGVFRPQVASKRGGDGKEVVDLLVVFGDHVLLFSDKHCAFPSGEVVLSWSRWFKRSILAGADQVYGAERWIREQGGRLFLDRKCTKPLPVDLPPVGRMKMHRIVVAHGAGQACRKYFGGGSGSLFIKPDVVGEQHYASSSSKPFVVGTLYPGRGYVHILDDTSTGILLETLDTVSDFVAYLEKKEALIASGRLQAATGEEEMLACYMTSLNVHGDHDFPGSPEDKPLAFPEGSWHDLVFHPQRQLQVNENKISYIWDRIIEGFAQHAIEGDLEFTSDEGYDHIERTLRIMAAEGRTRRRMISQSLYGLIEQTDGWRGARILDPSDQGEPHYVFLLLQPKQDMPTDEYRAKRKAILLRYCKAVKVVRPAAQRIVGIATETKDCVARSEDVMFYDASTWTSEDQSWTEEEMAKMAIFKGVKKRIERIHEYPELPTDPLILKLDPYSSRRNKL